VAAIAEGRVYTGSQALDKKLVDKLGSFSDAVDTAAELAKIPGEPVLVNYREENPFWQQFGLGAIRMLGLEKGLFPQNSGGLVEYKLSL
jgi:ClpP class serine protease